jgi:hypothetical protein
MSCVREKDLSSKELLTYCDCIGLIDKAWNS